MEVQKVVGDKLHSLPSVDTSSEVSHTFRVRVHEVPIICQSKDIHYLVLGMASEFIPVRAASLSLRMPGDRAGSSENDHDEVVVHHRGHEAEGPRLLRQLLPPRRGPVTASFGGCQ